MMAYLELEGLVKIVYELKLGAERLKLPKT